MTIRKWVGLGVWMLCWGCSSDRAAEIEEQRQAWLSKHPESYVVKICETGFLSGGCTLSAVSAGQVLAERSGPRQGALMDVTPNSAEPIDALFDRLLRESKCDFKALAFDPTYHYPSKYSCDYGEEGSGETVACFEPNTVDLAACPE